MALKPKGKDVANSAAIHSSDDTLSASTSPGRSNGNSKVIPGPRLGVYRPCARCRLKKTKCDRLRPSCSSCAKGGSDALCVYDNDEPGDGSDFESITPTPIAAPSSIGSKKDSDQQNRRKPVGSGYENGQESRSSNSNGNGNGNLSNYDSSSTDSRMDTTLTQLSTTSIERAPHAEPPQKKLKTGAGTSEAITPSPLRSSITTNREPVPREIESALDENVDIESIDAVDDQDISGLSIADATLERAHSEINQDDIPDTMEVRRNPVSTGAAKSKKQTKGLSTSTSGVGTGAHTKIMVELPTVRPSPMFVNKSQRARKWGRSSAIVQTLGGEISIPLWISDQDMLLNEPRPYFMQRVYPMSTLPSPFGPSSTSATATNLARLAVLNQMDNNGYDTPERGTTPESGEDDDVDSATTTTSITGAKRKRGPLSTAPGSSTTTGVGDDDAGDSSARSTPAPTSKPRPIPTRPRMYPCSFDGCGKSFMDKFHLKRHETRHVTQVIVCGIDGCTKAYDSISTMRRHQSMIHKERKEEIAAAAAAAAVAAAASASASASVTRSGTVEVEEGEEDGGSEISGSSPSPSSVTYTAMSSPARD
ncbi:hypothetical protein BGZ98_000958 [Dissophora globulifera]|nr:hypothetical protein BGZ98_000958 [Dissophora globulifera]